MTWWEGLIVLAGFAPFAARRLLTYLHIFQQEEYDGPRFLRWMVTSGTVDRKATVALIVLGLIHLFAGRQVPGGLTPVIAAAALAALAWREPDPRRKAKKALVLTARARRITIIAGVLLGLLALGWALFNLPLITWIVPVHLIPVSLALAVLVLSPQENRVQKRFWVEAHEKLLRLDPETIAITGSYGKTSVKHLLAHVLQAHAPTLATPGSVNTPMGISRIVREQLGRHHRFFICEMGAYGPGSIARLCRLVPVKAAVITAVGDAHHERFKSLDTVARTKFELAAAVAEQDGPLIVASDVLGFEAARAAVDARRDRVVQVGTRDDDDVRILSTGQGSDGVHVTLAWQGEEITLTAPLFGEHHARNLALVFATAAQLGVPVAEIRAALATAPQIAHRLEVKRQPDGSVLIDDAYNANPIGFAAALEVLDILVAPDGRRILVTPGMVELGDRHDQAHAEVGAKAATHVDILLPVIPERITAFIDAYQAGRADGTVVPVATFAEARAWLTANVRAGDAVLLENDLPDLYERKLSL